MNFEYFFEEQAQDSIDIEDTGNVCLSAFNDTGDNYFLEIKTECGWTTAKQFGPINPDFDALQSGFFLNYTKFEYDEKRLYKLINEFLNNSKRCITQVFTVDNQQIKTTLDKIVSKL